MNIFYLHSDPKLCAEWAVDRHVTKMLVESAQILSTAHRILDGIEYIDNSGKRKMKRWKLSDSRESILYTATHANHPSAVWARSCNANYAWLYRYLQEHCKEYTHRYGKIHKVEQTGLLDILKTEPNRISYGYFMVPPNAMDTKYIISEDVISNYRNYYKIGKKYNKSGKLMHVWTNRQPPAWITE